MNKKVDLPANKLWGNDVALLVIDVQKGLFDKSIPIYNAGKLLENINALADCAHRAGVPVFYVQHANESWLAPGSEGWQLHAGLRPLETDCAVNKRHGSAFQGTGLGQELEARAISRLIVTGLVTHGCVKATCLDAVKLGYGVTLVKDGHSNFHKKAAGVIAEWNQKLSEAGVELKSTQELVPGSQ
jgi:nicotinamidase-related amidase